MTLEQLREMLIAERETVSGWMADATSEGNRRSLQAIAHAYSLVIGWIDNPESIPERLRQYATDPTLPA